MRFTICLFLLTLSACQAPSTGGNELVVLSYNIHHGEGTDGVFDLERIAKVILDSGADLVALQEVDVKTDRASGVDQAAELARMTGMEYAFGRAIHYSNGEYGDAVLSRFPIESVERMTLPAAPNHEKRVAVVVTVKLPKSLREIRFVSTHLDHTKDPADRIAQATALRDQLSYASRPATILVGDLNAQPDSGPIAILLEGLTSAAPKGMLTFPSDQPNIQIDWILFSTEHNWEVLETEVIDERVASDHRPIRAILKL